MKKEFEIYNIKAEINRFDNWIGSLPYKDNQTDFQKERQSTWLATIQKEISKLQEVFKPKVNKTYLADFSNFNQNIDGEDGRFSIDFLRSMTFGKYVGDWETYYYEGEFDDEQERDEMVECFYCNAFYFHIDKNGNTIITGSPWDEEYEVNIVIPTNLFKTCLIACVEPINY